MIDPVRRYQELKEKNEVRQREYDRGQGVLQQMSTEAKQRFGAKTPAEVEQLLAQEKKLLTQDEAELDRLVSMFEIKYKDELD